jgi:LCP family protein required for cell wall assembly
MSLLRPDEELVPAAVPTPLPRKHPARHRIAVGFTIILALLVALVGAGVAYAAIQNSRINRISFKPKPGTDAAIAKVPKGDPVNILVVGNDSRAFAKDAQEKKRFGSKTVGDSLRSDTMMVMRLDPKNDRASILSIARDLYVDLEGGGKGRINEAFAQPGDPSKADPDRLIRTIRSNFGITVNHYVEMDFAGFREVVNAVGGLKVYFPFPARDEFSNLNIAQTGCVQLDGEQALSYVRARHYQYKGPKGWQFDGTGDIGRIQRQQDFIKRLVRKAVADGLTNPIKAARLIEAGIGNVKVDDTFGVTDMKQLASQLRDLDEGKIAFAALTGDPVTIDGNDVLKVNPARTNDVLAAFGSKIPGSTATTRPATAVTAVIPATTSLVLYNGSGRDGLVAQVQADFQRLGVRATNGGNGQAAATTQVRHRPGDDATARSVQAFLGGDVQLVPDRSVKAGEVQVLLGATFGGVVDPKSPATTTAPTAPAATPTTRPPSGSDPSVACA